MNIKSNVMLLAEMAEIDNQIKHEAEVDVNTVMEAYNAVPECVGETVTEAADVVVTPVGDDYYVEMTNLAPFMLDSGIKSVAKSLDMVAEANGLEPKSVGLVVESKSAVDTMLNNAKIRANKMGNKKILENAITKVEKNNNIIKNLMNEGYKVCAKREGCKVCPKCGKSESKCECGDANCAGGDSKAVIAEKCKKEGCESK